MNMASGDDQAVCFKLPSRAAQLDNGCMSQLAGRANRRFHAKGKGISFRHFNLRQDLKGRLGRGFQIALIVFAILTLGLIAFNL